MVMQWEKVELDFIYNTSCCTTAKLITSARSEWGTSEDKLDNCYIDTIGFLPDIH